MEYFSDTWFFVALLDERDAHHEEASNFADSLASVQVTTRWVLAEVANSLSAPFARRQVVQFLRKLESNPLIRVIGESDILFARGFDLYARRPDKEWSLTDCISFVVMEQGGLLEALTNDHHFEQAGFVPVFAGNA